MRISFIGSGNVATHLALALFNRGHRITQVWSRDMAHARLLADRVEATPIDDLAQLRSTASVYILAVSDDALYDLALDLHLGNALVLHTSGATSIDVLKPISSRYGVLWSPQTFIRDMAIDYSQLPFCIEGCDSQTLADIEEFANIISPNTYHTDLRQRQYLHLAAVMVSNFTNCLYGMAQQLCAQHDLPFEALYPIIATTSQRVGWGDVRYQLTGPAVRGDSKTIDIHRRLLADDPQLLQLYDQLTGLIQTRLRLDEDD